MLVKGKVKKVYKDGLVAIADVGCVTVGWNDWRLVDIKFKGTKEYTAIATNFMFTPDGVLQSVRLFDPHEVLRMLPVKDLEVFQIRTAVLHGNTTIPEEHYINPLTGDVYYPRRKHADTEKAVTEESLRETHTDFGA